MYTLRAKFLKDEYWYGGHTNYGFMMPVSANSIFKVDTTVIKSYGQANTLFVSNKGRVIWSEKGFAAAFVLGSIFCKSQKAEINIYTAEEQTLKGAYKFAVSRFIKPDGNYPDEKMFRVPQYCTWIQFEHNQTQDGIIKYARSILDCGMPAGELIIDDGWQTQFGDWRFDPKKFPNPEAMTKELHSMGFSVILWICPFVSKKAADFEKLQKENLLVRDNNGETAVRHWWNGNDCLLDFSNPDARQWFTNCTDELTDIYGADGFKQDAGDAMYYKDSDITYGNVDANTQSLLWAQSAKRYRFNELRACFQCGGMGVAQRLADKSHKWNILGLGALIPNVLIQGLSGYPFSCPDMIGGGQINDFKGVSPEKLDHELFARYCETSALMPMMQYSLDIWDLGNETTKKICQSMSSLHAEYGEYIIKFAKIAAETGEPIVRCMEYEYPGRGYAKVKSQFLLGTDILVAPVLKKGQREKTVLIPPGKWEYKGKIYSDEEVTLPCPIDELIYFKKCTDNQ